MKQFRTIIIGGGASGLLCAMRLSQLGMRETLVLEKNERLGRKLSATGNGQGNITNTDINAEHYFSSDRGPLDTILQNMNSAQLIAYFESLGGLFLADGLGRVYPASRQAASVTDILREGLEEYANSTQIHLGETALSVEKKGPQFKVKTDAEDYECKNLVLACGGKASPHFGTDGSGYFLAQSLGHTVTRLRPSLVQVKTEREPLKGLKGVRVDCRATLYQESGREKISVKNFRGDVLFTDYGISGDAVFRLSAFLEQGNGIELDFLPDIREEKIEKVLKDKLAAHPELSAEDFLRCIVNSSVGRAILRMCNVPPQSKGASLLAQVGKIAARIKRYPLRVIGDSGFANAQVTKGGVRMNEVDAHCGSKLVKNLYLLGELLDVDGECGGYNLHWAFTTGYAAANAIAAEEKNDT